MVDKSIVDVEKETACSYLEPGENPPIPCG